MTKLVVVVADFAADKGEEDVFVFRAMERNFRLPEVALGVAVVLVVVVATLVAV